MLTTVRYTDASFNFPMLIVFTTTPNTEEAETLARKIVEAKLAACVQVLPEMKSFYFWENADSERFGTSAYDQNSRRKI